jgi:hypothetical protein
VSSEGFYEKSNSQRIIHIELHNCKSAEIKPYADRNCSIKACHSQAKRLNDRLHGRLAQLVERFVYTEDVGSSSLSSPTMHCATKDAVVFFVSDVSQIVFLRLWAAFGVEAMNLTV